MILVEGTYWIWELRLVDLTFCRSRGGRIRVEVWIRSAKDGMPVVGHLKVPLIEAQGLGAKFVFSF